MITSAGAELTPRGGVASIIGRSAFPSRHTLEAIPPSMSAPDAHLRPSGAIAGVAALGVALRLLLTWCGWLDPRLPTDDAYYYYTIARNAVAGGDVSFDGLTPTNGFHPLWMVTITPLFMLAEAVKAGPWFAVRSALTVCALLDLATGLLLYTTLLRLGRPIGARWAVGLWFLFPTNILLCLLGLEGAISATVIRTDNGVFVPLASWRRPCFSWPPVACPGGARRHSSPSAR